MNIGYWLHLGYGYYFGYKVDGYSYWLITKPKVYGYYIWLNSLVRLLVRLLIRLLARLLVKLLVRLLVRLLVVPITLSVRVINTVSCI